MTKKPVMPHHSPLHTLHRAECLRLLRTVEVGRIVYTEFALLAVQPVNFILHGADRPMEDMPI